MNVVIVLLLGMVLGFGLGWISQPKYSPAMSRKNQVLLVAGVTLAIGFGVGLALGVTGWSLVAVCLLLPVAMVTPYVGGFARELTAKAGR